jgi:hypothetical protein
LALRSPFRGDALSTRFPSCSAVCGWFSFAASHLPQSRHAPGSNASNFAAGAISAPACRLDAGSSLGGWGGAHNWQRSPCLCTQQHGVGFSPSRLRWLNLAFTGTPSPPSPSKWVRFPHVRVGPSLVHGHICCEGLTSLAFALTFTATQPYFTHTNTQSSRLHPHPSHLHPLVCACQRPVNMASRPDDTKAFVRRLPVIRVF